MIDLKQSYLVPFDANDTGEPFGFMRANIGGREQWWLVQVWAENDRDDTIKVRFLEQDGPGTELVDFADNYAGLPWYPIPWISDDIPRRRAPSFRLSLDMPEGNSITQEWGPDEIGDSGRKEVAQMLDKVFAGFVDG